MFESLRKKIRENNEDNSSKNISFDFKLMFVYHIFMMILFGVRPLDNSVDQVLFAFALGFLLFVISIIHKFKAKWRWPGLSLTSIPGLIFNIVFSYVFFAFAAYSMNANIPAPDFQSDDLMKLLKESWTVILQAAFVPVITPWYLAGIGIVAFNVLSSLNLVCSKKIEFESQCINS